MLLQIVSLSLNIRLNRLPIRQRDLCDFPLGRIRLLRLGNENLVDHALFERVVLEEGSGGAFRDLREFTADCLVEG
jgi:hypothetical protein